MRQEDGNMSKMTYEHEGFLGPSESTQVLMNLNRSFHKHDPKAQLAKKLLERRKYKPPHLAKRMIILGDEERLTRKERLG